MEEWEQLAIDTKAQPFAHPGFLLIWQRWFGHGELLVATVRRSGVLVGVLPLVRRRRVLSYPANWHTPIASILARDEPACAALAGAVARVGATRIAIALLDGADVRLAQFSQGMRERRYRVAQRAIGYSPYRVLAGDWEEFESQMNAKERRDLGRRRRRLDELGTVSVQEVTSVSGLDGLLDEAIEVEGSSWKERRGTAIGAAARTAGFYTEVAHWAARNGWLRLTFLRLDDKPLAMSLALCVDGVHYGLKTGYDASYARYVPGLLLMHEIMRSAFATGLTRVEMLGEDDAYKRIWCDDVRERVGLQVFAPSLGGAASWVAFTRLRPLAAKFGARRVTRLVKSDGPRL
jgi:CelD/BcsL family acetyltransferase involved in cellulose biosynthesis